MKKSDSTIVYDVCVQCAHAKVLHGPECRQSNAWNRCYCSKYVAPRPAAVPLEIRYHESVDLSSQKPMCFCGHGFGYHYENSICFKAIGDKACECQRYQRAQPLPGVALPFEVTGGWALIMREREAQGPVIETWVGRTKEGDTVTMTVRDGIPTTYDLRKRQISYWDGPSS